MNDLEYRRKQMIKLQDSVIDIEDLSKAVLITDQTLTDFRINLAKYLNEHPGAPERRLAASSPTRLGGRNLIS